MNQPDTIVDTVAAALARRTRDRGHRPLLTVYDDLVGVRTELSYATADNWAAKTANLLTEELDLQSGATVALDVDAHWTAAVVALACWRAGLAVAPHDAQATADVVCCHASRLAAHGTGPVLVVGDGLRAEPLEPVPPRDGLVVLGDEVHVFADDHDTLVEAATPALVVGSSALDHAAVVARASRVREAVGDGARIGLTAGLDGTPALLVLAGAVLAGGSVVAERPAPDGPRWDRWETERTTAVAGHPSAPRDAPDGITVVDLRRIVGGDG